MAFWPGERAALARSSADILELAREQAVEFVNLQFIDIVGMVKSVTIPIGSLAEALERGVWFDGSSVDGFARIAESDMYLVPDCESYALVPWERGAITARLICNIHTPNGRPFAGDPRRVLAAVLEEAAAQGYRFVVGTELEFFLFRADTRAEYAPTPADQAGYFDFSAGAAAGVRQEVVAALQAMGVAVDASHHEVADGQHEIDFRADSALHAADQIATARAALKAVAQQHGLYATFMPKPVGGINGSGLHCHQSLIDLASDDNAFSDPKDSYGLSATARHFIAGQLAHAPAMIAVLAPLVNSYKRLVPGYEAPVYLSWSRTNRSSLVRVPRLSPSRPQAARAELRCPDPACNPYLAFAVMLAAGMRGISEGYELPVEADSNLFEMTDAELAKLEIAQLPQSLSDALRVMEGSRLVQEALGEHIFEWFLRNKRVEWRAYKTHVSAFEVDR
ncbi:MAG: type I glutamate--ammonia ligase, partial [Chloroflexales bacterium]|nr:type I glutamate--ammonia ligase [Chloroflexales bacterium]